MKMIYYFVIFLTFFVSFSDDILASQKKIKVLFTSALIKENALERKKAYIRNIKLLDSYGAEVYIVESCSIGPTYLDDYCKNVCYTHSNDPERSKSRNEALSMRIGLDFFDFDQGEIIIKITGRYVLETPEFLQLIKNNTVIYNPQVLTKSFSLIDYLPINC